MLWLDTRMLNTNISLKYAMNLKECLLDCQLVMIGMEIEFQIFELVLVVLKYKLEALSRPQGRYQCRLCLPGRVYQFPLGSFSSGGVWSSCSSSRTQLMPSSSSAARAGDTLSWQPRCPAHCVAAGNSPACTSG